MPQNEHTCRFVYAGCWHTVVSTPYSLRNNNNNNFTCPVIVWVCETVNYIVGLHFAVHCVDEHTYFPFYFGPYGARCLIMLEANTSRIFLVLSKCVPFIVLRWDWVRGKYVRIANLWNSKIITALLVHIHWFVHDACALCSSEQ